MVLNPYVAPIAKSLLWCRIAHAPALPRSCAVQCLWWRLTLHYRPAVRSEQKGRAGRQFDGNLTNNLIGMESTSSELRLDVEHIWFSFVTFLAIHFSGILQICGATVITIWSTEMMPFLYQGSLRMLNYLVLTQKWLRSFPEEMGQLRRRVRMSSVECLSARQGKGGRPLCS